MFAVICDIFACSLKLICNIYSMLAAVLAVCCKAFEAHLKHVASLTKVFEAHLQSFKQFFLKQLKHI
jgi:hypothetical protein